MDTRMTTLESTLGENLSFMKIVQNVSVDKIQVTENIPEATNQGNSVDNTPALPKGGVRKQCSN